MRISSKFDYRNVAQFLPSPRKCLQIVWSEAWNMIQERIRARLQSVLEKRMRGNGQTNVRNPAPNQ